MATILLAEAIKDFFTFQSGSIQIDIVMRSLSNLVYFTFQSGSIQMPLKLYKEDATGGLYIPIWFYSNSRTCKKPYILWGYFTFQSGSIQMYQKEYDTSTPDFFTFQSGSIQILYSFRQGQLRQNVTFQSGSIQILERTFVNLQ